MNILVAIKGNISPLFPLKSAKLSPIELIPLALQSELDRKNRLALIIADPKNIYVFNALMRGEDVICSPAPSIIHAHCC